MSAGLAARVAEAWVAVAARTEGPVETALVLGSGLGHLAEGAGGAVTVPYGEIPGLAVSTAPGHAGRLVIGEVFGTRMAMMDGRLHLYEGWSPAQIAFPVYLLKALGARRLIVTNASGALNPDFAPGEVMLIEDHLNFTGANPLTGANDDAVGLRFPDLSRAYDPALQARAIDAAKNARVSLRRGVYAGIAGPSLETSAERRFLRASGGDAVGMSTVLEVIAAAHAGLPVLGLSAIANSATGAADQSPDTIEDVLAIAAVAGEKIATILERLMPGLDR
jgi:purine-nucleoside phosphorylase